MSLTPQTSFFNNLKSYYEVCSYGKSTVKQEHTVVVGPIKVPCNGVLYRGLTGPAPPRPPPARSLAFTGSRRSATVDDWWDSSQFCTASEQDAWRREAQKIALAVSGCRDMQRVRLPGA